MKKSFVPYLKYEYLRLPSCRTWTMLSEINNSRGIIILPNGSGEYRSVFQNDNFDLQIDWLNSSGFSVIKYDKYGCGESSGDYKAVTMDILVDQLADLAGEIKKRHNLPVIIMGHSEGSIIAAESAIKTQSIDALILRVASHQNIKDRIKLQLNNSDRSGESYNYWLIEIQKIEEKIRKNTHISGFLNSHPRTYWASRLNRKLTGDVVKQLSIPIFALNGADDYYTPQECFEKIHQNLEHHHNSSRAKTYLGVGHSLRKSDEQFGSSEADKDIIIWLKSLF